MIKKGESFELDREYGEYLNYLRELAACKYGDHPDVDSLIQDTIMALVVFRGRGGDVKYPKGFLADVMKKNYNSYLRAKYRNNVVLYGFDTMPDIADERGGLDDAEEEKNGEYAAVRRELGRLIGIYREVAVRHYVKGESVERIANELNIPVGTVKSRLASSREQIKEGLKNMETYSSNSFEPKWVSMGIDGGAGLSGEPFSLLSSEIESNLLVLAYENPVSIRELAGALGMPATFVEPIVDKLVNGELMGRTAGGLVYTRCFLMPYADSMGNIPAQEALAEKYAAKVWEIVQRNTAPLTELESFGQMSEKQRATLILFAAVQALQSVAYRGNSGANIPERPNAGHWLAIGTVFEHGQKNGGKYAKSGPVHVSYSDPNSGETCCQMLDFQSSLGDAHWGYYNYENFKYRFSLENILRFYASFLPCGVKPDNDLLYDTAESFEKLYILKRGKDGELGLDIPALTFEEYNTCFLPAVENIKRGLEELLGDELQRLYEQTTRKVPKHVDEREYFIHEGALGAYAVAQITAIIEQGLMPYPVEIGKTPIILVTYKKR